MTFDNNKVKTDEEYLETITYIKNLTKFGINLGLERIQALLNRLGNPEKELNVIHIGGTNGKGSTTAILQAILKQAGYKAGMFISPHLHDFRERISINGELIQPEDIVIGMNEIRPQLNILLAEGVEHPTEFEVSTALALLYFAKKRPDFVLMEVGLGGEIDSTNVVHPLISVITHIGMDHMDYLGTTIEEIAQVKAGIIKEGIPVVTSATKPQALQIIEEQAHKKGSELIMVGRDIRWQRVEEDLDCFDYCGLTGFYPKLKLRLQGEHQFINASTALVVVEILQTRFGYHISETAIRQGLNTVKWPGRLELISENPKILLDGAHNVDGMESLAQALRQYAQGLYKRDRLIICLGMLGDKEIVQAVSIIGPLADEIVVTKPDSLRAADWEYPAILVAEYLTNNNIHVIEDPILAVHKCLEIMDGGDMLCVTGSLYLIAPVREYLKNFNFSGFSGKS